MFRHCRRCGFLNTNDNRLSYVFISFYFALLLHCSALLYLLYAFLLSCAYKPWSHSRDARPESMTAARYPIPLLCSALSLGLTGALNALKCSQVSSRPQYSSCSTHSHWVYKSAEPNLAAQTLFNSQHSQWTSHKTRMQLFPPLEQS